MGHIERVPCQNYMYQLRVYTHAVWSLATKKRGIINFDFIKEYRDSGRKTHANTWMCVRWRAANTHTHFKDNHLPHKYSVYICVIAGVLFIGGVIDKTTVAAAAASTTACDIVSCDQIH